MPPESLKVLEGITDREEKVEMYRSLVIKQFEENTIMRERFIHIFEDIENAGYMDKYKAYLGRVTKYHHLVITYCGL